MSNGEQVSPPTPKSALDQLKEWKELISFIAVWLASILGGILSEGTARAVSWGAAVVLVAVGGWWVRRSWLIRKRRAGQEKRWAERQAHPRRTAFRSLAPFEERDELPGKDRTQQARSIATRITSDDFRFGIVCGDSGCGKTSLLRTEVTRHIRAAGLEAVYLRSPRRLAAESSKANSASERLAAELFTLGKSIPLGECVLILDQFEEWFIEYREPEVRLLLGRFISGLTKRAVPLRTVCAIRREFLIDFHDLAAELPDPTAPNTTFMIRNFTVDQAIDVTNQCAAADGLSPDEAFAKTIANDLVEGGEVRPPELQIVCTYLADTGSLSTGRYRSGGGTAGILAHYIKDALGSCRSPEIGARLLRTLCDFPARAKRRPKTIQELGADIASETVATNERLETLIVDHVRIFVLARLLTVEKRRDAPDAFALMHDYLVGAVELATSDASTQTEEANQLLRYYLAERRGTIPLFKLRFIRAHADRPLLAQRGARRLTRRSLALPTLYLSATVLIAFAMGCGVYLFATAGIKWKAELIEQHWLDEFGGSVSYQALPETGRVISYGGEYIRLWDTEFGTSLRTFKRNLDSGRMFVSRGDFGLLTNRFAEDENTLIRLSDGKEWQLPSGRFSFSNSPEYLRYIARSINGEYNVGLVSKDNRQKIREILNVPIWNPREPDFEFSTDGQRLVAVIPEGNRPVVALYNAFSGQKLANLTDKGKRDELFFAIDTETRRVCTFAYTSNSDCVLQLWNLDNGSPLGERKLSRENQDLVRLYFTHDGPYLVLLLSKERKRAEAIILGASDLEPPRGTTISQMHLTSESSLSTFFDVTHPAYHGGETPSDVCWWPNGNGVFLWKLGNGSPIYLPNERLGDGDDLIVSGDLQRAVIWGHDHVTEMWDLKLGKPMRMPAPIGPLTAQFTLNDSAVAVFEQGGQCSLFAKQDGSPLAQHITVGEMIYYDPDLRRFHLWNLDGQVLRYVEGRNYFGRFIPTKPGADK